MKRAFTILSVVFALAAFAPAQQTVGESVRWTVGPPPTVSGLTVGIVGNPGRVTIYYWVAARYPSGLALPAGPVRVNNTAGIANLSVTQYVALSWRPASGATGYYIIRQAQPQFPQAGSCTSCVVAANQAGTTFNDQGGATTNWPPAGVAFASGASLALSINNRDQSSPFLEGSGVFHWKMPRNTGEYAYGFDINADDDFFVGTGQQKSYLLSVRGERPAGFAATGDSNDAVARFTYNNYAANDANFIIRGINSVVNNRSGGTLGFLTGGLISASSKSGSTSPTVRGLEVNVENFGTNADEHSGIDVTLKNEGAKSTLEYGVRVRNIDNSTANAADAAFLVADSGTNTGWSYGLDTNGATIGTADVRMHNGATINNPSAGIVSLVGALQLSAHTFAGLPAGAADGTVVYCSNCDQAAAGAGPTVCASSPGTGTLAIRLAGAWTCLGI